MHTFAPHVRRAKGRRLSYAKFARDGKAYRAPSVCGLKSRPTPLYTQPAHAGPRLRPCVLHFAPPGGPLPPPPPCQGRAVLWGWLQEKPRKVGSYDYAGCLTLPRLMYLQVGMGLGVRVKREDLGGGRGLGEGARCDAV